MVDYSDIPSVQILADTEAALVRMRQTAESAGCRIASASLMDSDPGCPAQAPGTALLMELEGEAGGVAMPWLDRAREEAESGGRRIVVSAPFDLVDLVAARTGHANIEHLCAADEDERRAAVARAIDVPRERLCDNRRAPGFPVFQPLLPEGSAAAGPAASRADAMFIRTLIRTRRLRAHYFRADLFADPAWDMLLDLMAARLEGKKVAVSSLCIAAAVPPTTALRWIGILVESGLALRIADPDDGRRVHIELAEPTARALGAWLQEMRRMIGGALQACP